MNVTTSTTKAIRCHWCDQLHVVSKGDRVQRLGRLYYAKQCPTVDGGLTIVSTDQLVALP